MTNKQYAELLCAIGTLSKISGSTTTIPQDVIDALNDRYTKEEIDTLLDDYEKINYDARVDSLLNDFGWVAPTENNVITYKGTKVYLNRYKVIDDSTTPVKVLAELTTDTKDGIFTLENNAFGFDFEVGTTLTVLHMDLQVERKSEQMIMVISDRVLDSSTGNYVTGWTSMTPIM